MPFSDPSNVDWFKWLVGEINPKSVVDVGPGAGKYGSLIREVSPETATTAVEIWEPYVATYGLANIYDKVVVADARDFEDYDVDLVILGDVLEHMSRVEAVTLWNKVRSKAKAAMISMPIIHFPQGCEHGNPYETHVEDNWTHEEILATFEGITGHTTFQVTGTYIAEFTHTLNPASAGAK